MEQKLVKDVIEEEDCFVTKAYKEKPYLNSNKDPFGLTISKDYINAHETIKGLIKKGKDISIVKGRMKILDAIINKAMINAIVEVTSKEGIKGNAELKVYNPSLNKKKGATIEIRKVTDFDYVLVEALRNIITGLLDCIISGRETGIHNIDSKNKTSSRVTSKPKLFTCDVCSWQTKFGSALKAHMKRIHSNTQAFESISSMSAPLDDQIEAKETRKRSKIPFQCKKDSCDSAFEFSDKLKEHIITEHENLVDSPSSSPPRKKFEKDQIETEDEMLDLDDIEINIEKELSKIFLLEKRIKELETLVATLLDEKEKDG